MILIVTCVCDELLDWNLLRVYQSHCRILCFFARAEGLDTSAKNYMIFYFLNLETDLHSIFQYINEILSVICLKDSSLFRLCLLLFGA